MQEEIKQTEFETLEQKNDDSNNELQEENQNSFNEEQQEEYVDPQKEAKEFLNSEEGIEFTQTLEKEDIKEMNIFLIKHDSSNLVKRVFLTFVGTLFITLSIVNKKNYYMIALGSIVIIYATILYNVLRLAYLRSRLDKSTFEPLEVNVKVGSKHIRYQLKEETDSPLVSFDHVYKVVERQNYIYLFINRYSIIVFKLDSLEQKEELIQILKNKYLPRKAYFENK